MGHFWAGQFCVNWSSNTASAQQKPYYFLLQVGYLLMVLVYIFLYIWEMNYQNPFAMDTYQCLSFIIIIIVSKIQL